MPIERTYKYNNSTVTIKFGNILDSESEVIVSSDDCLVTMSDGVSKAIRTGDTSGAIVEDVKKKIPAELGDVVVSTSGSLPYKFVFHAITIGQIEKLDHSFINEEDIHGYIVSNTVARCLELLRSVNLSSIAFPAIGGGNAGIPLSRIAAAMANSISEFLYKTNKSYKIELFLFDKFNSFPEHFLDFFEQFAKSTKHSDPGGKIQIKNHIQEIIPEETATYDIFMSYSRKDSEKADDIADKLTSMGITVWIDRSGKYSGQNYKEVIVNKIDSSSIILFLSSENSNNSENVQNEIAVAVKRKKFIIPVKLDNSPYHPRIEYDLIAKDHIEYEPENEDIFGKIFAQLSLIKNKKS